VSIHQVRILSLGCLPSALCCNGCRSTPGHFWYLGRI